MTTTTHKPASRLTVAAFYGALWLLFAGTWFGWGQFNPADEKRVFAPMPRRFDGHFREGFSLYLRDHFGFRGWLVTLNGFLRAHILHASTSRMVIVGRDGFLFYTGEEALENYMGLKPMTDCELESWVQLFERRALWLASRNIPFAVLIVPDKETVYPEKMPIARGTRKTRVDRIVSALRSRTSIPLIDLRSVLTSERKNYNTYYLTDTHWSQWGAYSAYRELLALLNRSAPQIGPPVEPSALSHGIVYQPGDLNLMLGMNSIALEAKDTFEPRTQTHVTSGPDDLVMTAGTSNPAQPRLLFIRDSFGAALMPYLDRHFSRIYAPKTWTFDAADVDRERAGVVVFEIVERRFNLDPPMDPESALMLPSEFPVNPQAWGVLDEPFKGANLSGSKVHISGWALALQPKSIQKIELIIDGRQGGEMNLHLSRDDVGKVQPGQRDSASPGIGMYLDTHKLSNGRHEMVLKVIDSDSKTTELARRQFCVAN